MFLLFLSTLVTTFNFQRVLQHQRNSNVLFAFKEKQQVALNTPKVMKNNSNQSILFWKSVFCLISLRNLYKTLNLWMSGSEWKLAYPSKAEMWWEQFSNKLFFIALAEIIVYGFSLVNCIFSEHPGKTFCLVKGLAWGGTVIEKVKRG